jgi:hypothetical protein
MPKNDIFDDFHWHSSIGIDASLVGNRRFVTRLPHTRRAMSMFEAAGNDLLVHKTTRCLWKISDDKKAIEPVFSNDVLTEEEVMEMMEG